MAVGGELTGKEMVGPEEFVMGLVVGDIGRKRRRIEVLPEPEPKQAPARAPASQPEPVTTRAPSAS